MPISPLVGEMPGRAEGGAKDRQPLDSASAKGLRLCLISICCTSAGQRPLWPAGNLPHVGRSAASPTARPSLLLLFVTKPSWFRDVRETLRLDLGGDV
ncbi:MAG: hypothetical protein EOR00_07410 [Mesorhizobium sp.]|nr:MAG: hypothetical protein EOR00_07410 [Mesorhizobium sp.]